MIAVTNEAFFPLQPVPSIPIVAFGTHIANRGDSSLEVLGAPTEDPLAMMGHQCIGWLSPRLCGERTPVGRMAWHDRHQHWHFDDFAIYELRRLDGRGAPDFSVAGLVVDSTKASFCLEDSAREEGGHGADGHFYQSCTGALQGISPGWIDIYGATLPGQWVPIENVPDGTYALVIAVDPLQKLFETDRSNNASWSVIELFDNGRQLRVVE